MTVHTLRIYVLRAKMESKPLWRLLTEYALTIGAAFVATYLILRAQL